MKRVFISVPMRDKTNEEIENSIVKLHQLAEIFEREPLKRVDNFDPDAKCKTNKDKMHLLSKAIDKMAECDIFIGAEAWGDYPDCEAERDIARGYGLKTYGIPYNYISDEEEDDEEEDE